MTRTDHSRRTALADARTTWWKPASLPGVWSRTASLADRDRRAAWQRIEKDGEQDAGAFCALRDWQPRGWECRPRSECATGVQQQRSAGGVSTASGAVMGLTISRSIIQSHGGRLWPSTESGRGTTFQFTLPIEGLDLYRDVTQAKVIGGASAARDCGEPQSDTQIDPR